MERLGVITPVDSLTDWVNSMEVVKEKNGVIRHWLDPRDINQAVKREHYKMHIRKEIMAQFDSAKYLSKLNAPQGF